MVFEMGRAKVLAAVVGVIVGPEVAGVEVDGVASLSTAIVGAAYILAEAWVDCKREGKADADRQH